MSKMTPKEKAKELLNKFWIITGDFSDANECALICVDDIIESGFGSKKIQYFHSKNTSSVIEPKEYWQRVKKEIELLKDE